MEHLRCQKDRFQLPDDVHYINCAYMAPLSRRVEEAGIAGVQAKRNPTVIAADDFFRDPDVIRSRFAALVNAPADKSIALIPAVSYGIAIAANNVSLGPGQRIIALREQFPSNVYSWRRLAVESGAGLTMVDTSDGSAATPTEHVLNEIDAATAIVAVPQVHWADGTLLDLRTIRERCTAVGAVLVVDGTQSVGALPFDVADIKPDLLVCAGYKWLLGPYGMGVAYVGDRFLNGRPLEENWIARAGSERFDGLVSYEDAYQPGALRFDVGERSNFILAPMLAAALDEVIELGPERIQAYCRELTAPTITRLLEVGYRVAPDAQRAGHLFGIRLPDGIEHDVVVAELRRRKVSVSFRGDAIRVAPHVYNDEADIRALEEALLAAATTVSA